MEVFEPKPNYFAFSEEDIKALKVDFAEDNKKFWHKERVMASYLNIVAYLRNKEVNANLDDLSVSVRTKIANSYSGFAFKSSLRQCLDIFNADLQILSLPDDLQMHLQEAFEEYQQGFWDALNDYKEDYDDDAALVKVNTFNRAFQVKNHEKLTAMHKKIQDLIWDDYSERVLEKDRHYLAVFSYLYPILNMMIRKFNADVLKSDIPDAFHMQAERIAYSFFQSCLCSGITNEFMTHFDLKEKNFQGGVNVTDFLFNFLPDFVQEDPYGTRLRSLNTDISKKLIWGAIANELDAAKIQWKHIQYISEQLDTSYNWENIDLDDLQVATELLAEELDVQRFIGDLDAPLSLFKGKNWRILLDNNDISEFYAGSIGQVDQINSLGGKYDLVKEHSREMMRSELTFVMNDVKNVKFVTHPEAFSFRLDKQTLELLISNNYDLFLKRVLPEKQYAFLKLKILSVIHAASVRNYGVKTENGLENDDFLKNAEETQAIVDELVDTVEGAPVKEEVLNILRPGVGVFTIPGLGVQKSIVKKIDQAEKVEEAPKINGKRAPMTRTLHYGWRIREKTFNRFKYFEDLLPYDLSVVHVTLLNPVEAKEDPSEAKITYKYIPYGRKSKNVKEFWAYFDAEKEQIESVPNNFAYLQTSVNTLTEKELKVYARKFKKSDVKF